jgi:hypothetical protein
MFDVWRLRRERRKLVAAADRDAAAALKADELQRSHQIAADCYLACQRIDDRIARFLDLEIRQDTQELDIALPSIEEKEMWHHDPDGGVFLTSRGRLHLRKLVDAEKARRFEIKTLWVTKFWLPLLAALVGIIGALTGLAAVLQHKK